MKIDSATLEAIRERVAPLDTEAVRQRYREGDFPRSWAVRDLNKRYRWDLFYAAKGYLALPDSGGVTDAHVETALKRIVAPL